MDVLDDSLLHLKKSMPVNSFKIDWHHGSVKLSGIFDSMGSYQATAFWNKYNNFNSTPKDKTSAKKFHWGG